MGNYLDLENISNDLLRQFGEGVARVLKDNPDMLPAFEVIRDSACNDRPIPDNMREAVDYARNAILTNIVPTTGMPPALYSNFGMISLLSTPPYRKMLEEIETNIGGTGKGQCR